MTAVRSLKRLIGLGSFGSLSPSNANKFLFLDISRFNNSYCNQRSLSLANPLFGEHKFVPRTKYKKIDLYDASNNSLGHMDKWKADQLAASQKMSLLLVDDKKQPPIFQLVTFETMAEIKAEIRKLKPDKKVKKLRIRSNIDSKDLHVKINNLLPHAEKGHQIKVEVTKPSDLDETAFKNSDVGVKLFASFTDLCDSKLVANHDRYIGYMFKPKTTA